MMSNYSSSTVNNEICKLSNYGNYNSNVYEVKEASQNKLNQIRKSLMCLGIITITSSMPLMTGTTMTSIPVKSTTTSVLNDFNSSYLINEESSKKINNLEFINEISGYMRVMNTKEKEIFDAAFEDFLAAGESLEIEFSSFDEIGLI
ncbi:MAG: hypothetical protein ACRDDY_01705 [Clostridium sp.]|uniref:hypothetical protein n=1 Tax=Clostridium sp. TaxID=1506 RepID=UPI003EE6FC80